MGLTRATWKYSSDERSRLQLINQEFREVHRINDFLHILYLPPHMSGRRSRKSSADTTSNLQPWLFTCRRGNEYFGEILIVH